MTILGALSTIVIEWAALSTARWAYTEHMPRVFGIGLWPLLQLTLLVPAALWIAVWWSRRPSTAETHSRDH